MHHFGGCTENVKLLLSDPRVDPTARNHEAVINAARYGCVQILKLFLADERISRSISHDTIVLEALEKNEMVELFRSLREIRHY